MAIIIMPKQGLQMTEGVITRWLKKEGEAVAEGEPLFEMETDKLSITIDSSASGVLQRILGAEGDAVPVGEPIAVVGETDWADKTRPLPEKRASPAAPQPELKEKPAEKPVPAPKPALAPAPVPAPSPAPETVLPARRFATPRARMRAEERGLDWTSIKATGPDGLLIERDVLLHSPPAQAAPSIQAFQAVQVDMSGAVQLFKLFEAHGFAFDAADLLQRAASRAGERMGVRLSASVSRADLSASGLPDTLMLGETSPSGTAWLTLPCAGEPDQAAASLRQVQALLEHPLLLL